MQLSISRSAHNCSESVVACFPNYPETIERRWKVENDGIHWEEDLAGKLLILRLSERGRNRTFNLLIECSRGAEEPDISSHCRINDLPIIEPARNRLDRVLKRSTLAHIGPKCTAHLWDTVLG